MVDVGHDSGVESGTPVVDVVLDVDVVVVVVVVVVEDDEEDVSPLSVELMS